MIRRASRSLVVCLCVEMATACAHAEQHGHTYRSVDEVVHSVDAWEGQTVTVKGYLRFGEDSRNLWSDAAAYAYVSKEYRESSDPGWNRCISLFDIDDRRERLLSLNNHSVVVTGVVRHYPREGEEIRLDTCSDIGISIRSVEPARP